MIGIRLAPALARSASITVVATCLLVQGGAALAQGGAPAGNAAPPSDAVAEEIVVTGIRASLEQAMAIKRDSAGVVDAISAEDMGKFPDTNLAESLQRIPGVSINRVNGEGSQVTVRGFGPQFNLVTVNGRQFATSSINAVGGDQNVDFGTATSRSFDFSNLASEGVRRLEVYKTGRAENPSGGIGATINVVTQRPLDGPEEGFRGSIGGKGLYDASKKFTLTPEASGVLTWSNAEDTFGVTVFGSYQKRKSAAASATSNDWNVLRAGDFLTPGTYVRPDTQITGAPTDPDQLVSVPNDSRYDYSTSRRERINGQGTIQFRPIETVTLTADAFFAQNRINEERSDQTNWFNRPFNQVKFDDNPIVATTVFLQENENPVKDIGFEQQYRATKSQLQSYGINAAWDILDNLKLSLDANTSKSKSVPDAANGASSTLVSFGAPVVASHSVDFSSGFPIQDWTLNDAVKGNNNGVLDIGDLGTQVQRTNAASQHHRLNQYRADLGWDFGDGGRFDIGTTYTDSKMTSRRVQTQQTLGDWGITNVGDIQEFAGDLVKQFCMACKFNHYKPGDAEIGFRGNAVDLYEALAKGYADNPIDTTSNTYDRVQEKIWATYAQLTWKGELMGRKAGLVAGARFENTKVTSNSLVAQPARIDWKSDNDFTVVVSDNIIPIQLKGEYNNLLPSIDFQIEPMDHVIARMSYSKTLARPDYASLFASQGVGGLNRPTALGGNPTGTSGNPNLKPLVSDNYDVSLEWYYGRSSYVSAGFFYKKVKNFVGQGQVEQPLFGLRDPSSGEAGTRSGTALTTLQGLGVDTSDVNLFTMTALLIKHNGSVADATTEFRSNLANGQLNQQFVDQIIRDYDVTGNADDPLFNFSVATPINNRQGNIYGFELQAQHFFGDTGFGISGSYTKVYGDIGVDIGADPGVDVFALIGLSDSYNVTGIYDKNGISARVSYNWRSKYLSAINRGASRNPVFVAPFGTLDVNISYDITENIAVSVEAINILSENVVNYGRDKSNLWFAQELQPRVLFGARYRF